MLFLPPNLEAFHAVADAGTVHGAARALRLTQTAVTRRLAALEEELGQSLFLRSRRGMSLTDAGVELLASCRQAFELEAETMARLTGQGKVTAAHLRVQGPSSVSRSRVIPSLVAALKSQTNVTLEFRISDSESSFEALKRGEVDLAVLPSGDVVDEFDSKRLKPERYLLVGPKAWAKRKLKDIVRQERIVDFDPSDDMTFRTLEVCGLRDDARPDRHFVNNTDALASLVQDGLGYSVLSAEFAGMLERQGKLAVLAGNRHYDHAIALAWYPRKHPPAYFRAALDALR